MRDGSKGAVADSSIRGERVLLSFYSSIVSHPVNNPTLAPRSAGNEVLNGTRFTVTICFIRRDA